MKINNEYDLYCFIEKANQKAGLSTSPASIQATFDRLLALANALSFDSLPIDEMQDMLVDHIRDLHDEYHDTQKWVKELKQGISGDITKFCVDETNRVNAIERKLQKAEERIGIVEKYYNDSVSKGASELLALTEMLLSVYREHDVNPRDASSAVSYTVWAYLTKRDSLPFTENVESARK